MALFTDIHQLESHLEATRRQNAEARDPALNQMQSYMETLKRTEESRGSVGAQVEGLAQAVKANTTQIYAAQSDMETKISQQITR